MVTSSIEDAAPPRFRSPERLTSTDMAQSEQHDDRDERSSAREARQPVEGLRPTNETHRPDRLSRWSIRAKLNAWQLSPTFVKTVIKCVLAYFLASLFTYVPVLSHRMALLLPNHDPNNKVPFSNLHFIATVATYFHPGRSVGSMVEANVFALLGFAYAIVLALTSMTLAVYMHEHDMPYASNTISVVLFVGVGTALVGYAKVYVARPTFNTACSLIGVLIFTVIVKEGSSHLGQFSTDKIWQVTLVVITGVVISNAVCFLLWPQSATTSLQYDIQRNLRSFSTLLNVLTKTFLMDDVEEFSVQSKRIKSAVDNHHASFVSLKKNLEEAKLEAPFDVRIRGRVSSYVHVVDSLNVLAQHLGGLRTSCSLQQGIMDSVQPRKPGTTTGAVMTASGTPKSVHLDGDGFGSVMKVQSPTVMDEPSEFMSPTKTVPLQSAFEHYLQTMGPHVRTLVSACGRTLKGLTTAFEATVQGIDSTDGYRKDVQSGETFEQLARTVRSALIHFKHERTVAIKRSYSIYPRASASSESLAALKGLKSDEDVFLIFYFVFLLEEFARELEKLVDALEVIRKDEKQIQEDRSRPWHRRLASALLGRVPRSDRWGRSLPEESFGHTLVSLFVSRTSGFTIPSPEAHQPNTTQTPRPMTRRERLNSIVWRLGEFMKQADTKFAIKTGLGCAVLASPAFIASLRPIFTQYQGQWALISFLVVLSPTVGQSNQMSVHRILGTIAGATAAVAGYWLFPDNNVALPLFGALFAVPCFHFIISKPQFASTGRFVLLTFNLTALYSYNVRKVGIEVEEIAARRTVDVVVGVVWATVLNHAIWPIEARRELAKGLSDLLFKLAFLYQKLVLAYSSAEGMQPTNGESAPSTDAALESQPLLDRQATHRISEIQSIELALQVQLIKLEGLLSQTQHEPRLKGPFPVGEYRSLLGCCQHVLDLLHTMNLVTTRPDWHTSVRQDFVLPVDAAGGRRSLVGNVGLFFWLLASAFRLKTPLPPFLPPAEEARVAVLETIRQLPVVKRRAIRGSSEYLLYFAYAVSMKDLIRQLEQIGTVAQGLFGVLGGDVAAWEDQFRPSADEQERMEMYMNTSSVLHSSSSEADTNAFGDTTNDNDNRYDDVNKTNETIDDGATHASVSRA